MKPLKLIFTVTAATTLALTGCKKKDKGAAPSDQSLPSKADMKSEILGFSNSRDVDQTNSQAAIDFLSDEGIEWGSISGSNGNYTFSDIMIQGEDIRAETLKVAGLRLIGDELPFADALELKGVRNQELSISHMGYSMPAGEKIVLLLDSGVSDEAEMADAFLDAIAQSSGGGFVEGIRVADGDANFNFDFIGLAKAEDKMSVLFEGLNFKNDDAYGDQPSLMTLGHFSISDLDLSSLKNSRQTGAVESILEVYTKIANPYERGFESVAVRDVRIIGTEDDAEISGSIPRGDIWYTKNKKGVYHFKSKFPEMNINLDPEIIADSDLSPEMIRRFGFDKMSFSYLADARIDKSNDNLKLLESEFAMKDNFALAMTYDIDGFAKYYELMGQFMGGYFGVLDTLVTPSGAQEITRTLTETAKQLKVNSMAFEFRDRSIIDKVFQIAVIEAGEDEASLRDAAKGAVAVTTVDAQSEYQSQLAEDYVEALHNLIDQGGTFRVSMKPDADFEIGEVIETGLSGREMTTEFIDDILRQLNIDFEHSAK